MPKNCALKTPHFLVETGTISGTFWGLEVGTSGARHAHPILRMLKDRTAGATGLFLAVATPLPAVFGELATGACPIW